MISHSFQGERPNIAERGEAFSGVSLEDAHNAEHAQIGDFGRWAAYIQIARDAKDYAEADRLRARYSQHAVIENTRTSTIVRTDESRKWFLKEN